MKILITGAAGFLGSHLADRMLALGHEVIGVDNMLGGERVNVHPDVQFYDVDCSNLHMMNKLMEGCEVVFHAACTAHDGFSVFSPYVITQNTFQITMSVLSAAIRNKVKRFVYCSSMSRYGEQNRLPFTEEMTCNPRVPYAVAKVASEQIVQQLCELNGVEYVIIVPHNIIGPRQKYNDPYRNVAAIMINRILQNKQPIIYGDGNQKRCFSFIDDVIYCLEKVLTQNDVNKEIINIGPDEEFVTINELASTIANCMNFNLDPIYVPHRPLEVRYATCSADKARKLLNYTTKVTLEDGIQQMVDFIAQRGPKPFEYNLEIEINNEKTPKTWSNELI
ncbi:NAD-dependent epimerase/dehydratase family protein [Paenibacillus kobensis]|uniref:NAD-dependent epimerase/dehydratase family protein n=1 Tax=Paenibacillus kobensis TaxID=59841 RepID=UPI000FDA4264|nr:NAD-dependent epimerase/dehydratase family protein [Paenibacillus kobensis]